MPLVISEKARKTFYLKNHDELADTLGHSDFDGEDWVIGDLVVFEDGTIARIERVLGEQFHGYSDPVPANLLDVLAQVRRFADATIPTEPIETWQQLFEKCQQPVPEKTRFWRRTLPK